jgi:hypothetical protein
VVVRTCLGVAWTILVVGITFAVWALLSSPADLAFRMTLFALILGESILVSALVALIGRTDTSQPDGSNQIMKSAR